MSFQDYVKKKDAEQQTQPTGSRALKSLNEKAKNEAIITLGKKLNRGTAYIETELAKLIFGFVDNREPMATSLWKANPSGFYTRQQGSPVSGRTY